MFLLSRTQAPSSSVPCHCFIHTYIPTTWESNSIFRLPIVGAKKGGLLWLSDKLPTKENALRCTHKTTVTAIFSVYSTMQSRGSRWESKRKLAPKTSSLIERKSQKKVRTKRYIFYLPHSPKPTQTVSDKAWESPCKTVTRAGNLLINIYCGSIFAMCIYMAY